MPLPRYEYNGPIDHTLPIDTSKLVGKSVIITGGANGMGESCVRQFVAAGAYVTIGDFNDRGVELAKELNDAAGKDVCSFVKVDIRDWDQQKTMFETARSNSPHNSVDVVIANAGISRSSGDSMWQLDGMILLFLSPPFILDRHLICLLTADESANRSKWRATKAKLEHCSCKHGRNSVHIQAGNALL